MSRLRCELPPEILDNVLSRLPVHVLCRFRLVCKRWNHLLTQPGFASLCAQAPRRTPYLLISPKVLYFDPSGMERILRSMVTEGFNPAGLNLSPIPRSRNWEILDMAEKRFYSLSDSFMEDYLLKRIAIKEYWGWDKRTLAADGGLIYALYHGNTRRHVICNPVRRSFLQIPEPGFRCKYTHHIVVMSVDTATQRYKIIVMEAKNKVRSRSERVYMYDSPTVQWRHLCEVPAHHCAWSCVFLKGVFYTLFLDLSMVPWWSKLCSCDLETGAWSHIDVALPQPSHLQDKAQLVVSLDRLFFVEYTGVPVPPCNSMTAWKTILDNKHAKKKWLIKVRISEILLANKEVIKVGKELKYSKYLHRMLDLPHLIVGDPVVAVGCGDWIVISSLLGRRVGFDLVNKDWHELPTNTGHMYDSDQHGACDSQGMYSGLVDLDLREFIGEVRPEKMTM